MFLRLFLTLLLMAGLTVDFHTMSLGFGTAAYAFDDEEDGYEDGDGDEDGDDDDGYFDGWDLNDFVNYIESGEAEDDGIEGYVWTDPDDFMTNADSEIIEDAFDAQESMGVEDAEVTRSSWSGGGSSQSSSGSSGSTQSASAQQGSQNSTQSGQNSNQGNQDTNQNSGNSSNNNGGGNSGYGGWTIGNFESYANSGQAAQDGVVVNVYQNPNYYWNHDPNYSKGLEEVVVSAKNPNKDNGEDYGYQFPLEPVNNIEPWNGEENENSVDPTQNNEEHKDECEGEQCDICGGYKSEGIAFRSSGENAPNCPACTCVKTPMPDCDSITTYTGLLINTTEYKAALESMRTLSNSGTSACRLLFDNGIDEQNGLSRNLSVGDTYSDLGSAMSAKKSSEDVVGVVYSVGEGQHMLTDRQMLDLVKYSTQGFSTAYVVDGSHVYAVRFENFNMSQTYLSKYEGYIMDDGEFNPDSKQGKIYEIAKGKTNGVLEAKSAMYNYMDISLSLLQSNTSDNGDLLFSKINSCYSQETKEVNTETCGEGGGK
ncbi:MAG: hypothetical protein IJP79_02095 [Paludibacteraceae bacterium]|nr:hypothetical protein [Paludibacteraceae bacterium]